MTKILDAFLDDLLQLNPDLASELGIYTNSNMLKDYSEAGENREYAMYKKYYSQLNSVDGDELSVPENALLYYLENKIKGEKYKGYEYLINHYYGFHIVTVTLLTQYHRIENERDVKTYIERIRKYEKRIRDVIHRTQQQYNDFIIPHISVIGRVANMLRSFIAKEPEHNIIVTHLSGMMEKGNIRNKNNYIDQVIELLKTRIYPAYKDVIDMMAKIRDHSHKEPGLWNLKNGDDFYAYMLGTYTTLQISPDDIHRIGHDEVKRIKQSILEMISKEGYSTKSKFSSIMSNYYYNISLKHPELFYSHEDPDKKTVLSDFQKIIDSSYLRVSSISDVRADRFIRAEHIPSYRTGATSAYYDPPSLDGKREGKFFIHPDWFPFKPSMDTLVYHEIIPGHHMQYSAARQSSLTHPIQNIATFIGYVEGWALYAERLAYEHQWLESDYQIMEYLMSELFRAVRLVVDTGIHSKKWSRQQAYDYMEAHLGWGSYAQIDRYSVWPGHACAYKMGEIEILKIREKFKKSKGNDYNEKDFHSSILRYGSLPFPILYEIVNNELI